MVLSSSAGVIIAAATVAVVVVVVVFVEAGRGRAGERFRLLSLFIMVELIKSVDKESVRASMMVGSGWWWPPPP